MDGMTQQNAALAKEAAAASLSHQSVAPAAFRRIALGQDEERELEDQAFHEPPERCAAASPMRLLRTRGAARLRQAFSGTAG